MASSEFERLRHAGSQREWERQDLLDITALAVASVYCDVVVTERLWVDAAKRAGLASRLNTTFLRHVEDLPAHVVCGEREQCSIPKIGSGRSDRDCLRLAPGRERSEASRGMPPCQVARSGSVWRRHA